MKNIFLIGFMGSGKSSVGKALSGMLRMDFADSDLEIERVAGKSTRVLLPELGEDEFRQLEIDAIKRLCGMENCVVSVGGGAVLNYINTLRMRKNGTVVLLNASPETVVKRLEGDDRPLLAGLEGGRKLAKVLQLMSFRRPFYDSAKDVEVATDGKSVDEVAKGIRELLGHEDGSEKIRD